VGFAHKDLDDLKATRKGDYQPQMNTNAQAMPKPRLIISV
jgi:hypothetical protein